MRASLGVETERLAEAGGAGGGAAQLQLELAERRQALARRREAERRLVERRRLADPSAVLDGDRQVLQRGDVARLEASDQRIRRRRLVVPAERRQRAAERKVDLAAPLAGAWSQISEPTLGTVQRGGVEGGAAVRVEAVRLGEGVVHGVVTAPHAL